MPADDSTTMNRLPDATAKVLDELILDRIDALRVLRADTQRVVPGNHWRRRQPTSRRQLRLCVVRHRAHSSRMDRHPSRGVARLSSAGRVTR